MNWDAIGAIGELLGATVTIATLAYLAVQIKQNSALSVLHLAHFNQEAYSRYRQMCIEHPEIISKTYKGEPLSEVESVIAQNIVTEAVFAAAAQHRSAVATDPDRAANSIKVGISMFRRHHWAPEPLISVLKNAGFEEFAELVSEQIDSTSEVE